MPGPVPSATDTSLRVLHEAILEVARTQVRLAETASVQLEVLQRLAVALNGLAAWLQTPSSSDLPDLLRDLIAKVDTANARLSVIEAKTDRLAARLER